MIKGKKRQLFYSNAPPFNNYEYNISIYTPSIEPIVKALFWEEIERAKARVKIDRNGYHYKPSAEYMKMVKQACWKKTQIKK